MRNKALRRTRLVYSSCFMVPPRCSPTATQLLKASGRWLKVSSFPCVKAAAGFKPPFASWRIHGHARDEPLEVEGGRLLLGFRDLRPPASPRPFRMGDCADELLVRRR